MIHSLIWHTIKHKCVVSVSLTLWRHVWINKNVVWGGWCEAGGVRRVVWLISLICGNTGFNYCVSRNSLIRCHPPLITNKVIYLSLCQSGIVTKIFVIWEIYCKNSSFIIYQQTCTKIMFTKHEIDFQFQILAIEIVPTNNIKGSKSIFKSKMCA